MENRIRAGIIGGAGYTGGELLRTLLNHPGVNIVYIHSRSNEGQKISSDQVTCLKGLSNSHSKRYTG